MKRPAGRPRLPSVARVAAAGDAAVRRFPEVAVCAAVSAFSAIVLLDAESPDVWWGLLRAASLGIPLFVAITLFCERHECASGRRWVLRVGAVAALAALYLLFERWQYWNLAQRYAHLSVTFHLLVAVAPYLGVDEPRGFWQYNRALLFRFLLATLYAAAVYAGLALALAALDNLFGVDVPELHYMRLFCLVGFLFHPLFFLAGVPRDFAALERDRGYPGGLRVFSQYVMLPLVALYVTILTAYLVRVLMTGTWPSGWISYLVSGLAVVGIFSLLMVHPDRMDGEDGWIDRYARAFWIAILPSAAMVLMALWQRLDQYGVTERRYLLGVLAVWLGGAALYAAITRTRRIRWIPLTLALLGLVTFVGPWSAYAVAEWSQAKRLEEILVGHGALADGRVAADVVEIPFDDWDQAEAVVTYLVQHHDTHSIDGWYAEAGVLAAVEDSDTLPELPRGLDERVEGVMAELPIRSGPSDRPFQLLAGGTAAPIPAVGYDFVVAPGDGGGTGGGGGGGEEAMVAVAVVDGDALSFGISGGGRDMVMRLAGREVARGSLAGVIEAAEVLRVDTPRGVVVTVSGLETEHLEIPAAQLTLDLSGDRWSARVVLSSLTLRPGGDGDGLTAADFVLEAALLRATEPPR